jgi:hypothetical protein
MKKVMLLLFIILITSCKSSVKVVETHSIDTVFVEKIITITPAQINTLVIDNPCDSIGNLRPFDYSFGKGDSKTKIVAKNNTIILETKSPVIVETNTKEKIVSIDTSATNKTVYKTPKWAWITMVVMSCVIVLLVKFRL